MTPDDEFLAYFKGIDDADEGVRDEGLADVHAYLVGRKDRGLQRFDEVTYRRGREDAEKGVFDSTFIRCEAYWRGFDSLKGKEEKGSSSN